MNVGDLVRLNPDYDWSDSWVRAGLLKPTYRVAHIASQGSGMARLEPVIEGTVIGPHGELSFSTTATSWVRKVIPI